MTGYAREDEVASAADLESGSPPYSRSDSPSPDQPLISRQPQNERNRYRDDDDSAPRQSIDSYQYSDDIERLEGDSQRSRTRYYSTTTSTSLRYKSKKYTSAIARWIKGPVPPETLKINPIFPDIQAIPIRILDNLCPKKRTKIIAWLLACAIWITAFVLVVHYSYFAGDEMMLGCSTNLWSKNSGCGINGIDCRSFANSTFKFRCPTDCGSARLLEPYTVGAQQLNYQSLVVGGGLPSLGVDPETRYYRADSFICPAATHADILRPNKGGCARLRKTGMQAAFPGSISSGIESVPFDAPFPYSYTVEGLEDSEPCTDLRWTAFSVTLVFNIIISLFTTNPTVFFWTLFCSIFWEVAMAGDPPGHGSPYDLIAIGATRFLPTAFAAYVIERMVVRRTLRDLNAQFEKTVLWVGACWFGALNNYTFDKWIPISRLTPHDLNQQPGAKAALAIIVVVLVGVAVFQALHIRREGNMQKYLWFYAAVAVGLGLLIAVPGVNLRIHHYILSLLLLPGTRIQTRPSLIYQGLLIGLFINGLAKWGWDGVLQTSAELRGDALLGSILPQVENVVVMAENVTIGWATIEKPWDAVSVIVNDVERYRGSESSIVLQRRTIGEIMQQSLWDNPGTENLAGDQSPFGNEEVEKMYIRVGYVRGSFVGDYTRAGTVFSNGTWAEMEAGAS
ncbi:hypothetical protein TWF569_005380 [Orbilia oligospora]|uniref:LCCL domain-containing protein n=1 Tax=Orbilia oligospora TaxID=2813651 RepID=A0A7C8MW96_ORBOL|nr:hypothetical protein TWF102_001578 [Orbilia oligospora]KAF3088229.1 hypothetical protein TWF103_001218 [Orbilia oligospora]KAF3101699.1 hypothetical protein TWF706_005458 [Orbilia oligospora]KAF3125299.1 hypothetical protein TWF703_011003 [Orbilia oligospora]KAF3148645.1 hypothetical protein TWF569_005380 [Orbilia oligospora]